jgi:hypothetical protein
MKPVVVYISLALLFRSVLLIAEPPAKDGNSSAEASPASEGAGLTTPYIDVSQELPRPFSLGATSYGISPLGLQFQLSTNLNRHLDLRNQLGYLSWGHTFSSEGWNISSSMTMASVGTSLDIYPFPKYGFHFSPGILFHNPAVLSGRVLLASPSSASFELNGDTYYSPATQPAEAYATANLRHTAFTLTTGWGTVTSLKAGRFSFPIELGVAFLGSPQLNATVIGGQVCNAQQLNCQDASTDPSLLSDLQAQANKYKSNLDLLRTLPIVSVGIAYHFQLRTAGRE